MPSLRTRPVLCVVAALVALLSQHAAATPCRNNKVSECKHKSGDPKSVQCADMKDPAWALQPCPAGYRKCRTDMNGFTKAAGGGFVRNLKCSGDKKDSSYCVRDCRGIKGKGCPKSGMVIYKGSCELKTDWAWRQVVSSDEIGDVVVSGDGPYQCLYKSGYAGPFSVPLGKKKRTAKKPSWVAACMRGPCPAFEFAGGKGSNPCKSSCPGTTPAPVQLPALKGDSKLKFTVTVYSYSGNKKVVAFTQTFNYGKGKVTLKFPASFKPSCGSYYIDYTPACGKVPTGTNPVYSFTVSDSISPKSLKWSKHEKVYTYTSQCGTKGTVAPTKFSPNTDKCTVGLQFPQVTDACGKKINVPDASLPFFVKWKRPAKPTGSFCPDSKVTLDAMTVQSYSVPESYLKGVTLEYSVKQGDHDLGSFASGVAPSPAKLGSKCDESSFTYSPQCADNPVDPVFKYTIDDSDITTKLAEDGLSYTYSSTCGASGVAMPKPPTVKKCTLELCFNPIRNKCGKQVTPKPIHKPFTVTWSAPKPPKGDFCPDSKVTLDAMTIQSISIPESYLKGVTLEYSVKQGDRDLGSFASGVAPSPAKLGSKCDEGSFTYSPQCADKPVDPVFKYTIDDSDITTKLAENGLSYTYSSTCGASGVAKPKSTTVKECTLELCFNPIRNKCGEQVTPKPIRTPFTVTWSAPDTPKGPFCPGAKVPLDAIKVTEVSVADKDLIKDVVFKYSVTTSKGSSEDTDDNIPSGSAPGSVALPSTGCGKVDVTYKAQCAAKPVVASFSLQASDKVSEPVYDPATQAKTYTSRCNTKPTTLPPKQSKLNPGDCSVDITYAPQEDVCGVKTPVDAKTIVFEATWEDPTKPAGDFCPNDEVTLPTIAATGGFKIKGTNTPVPADLTTGLSLTFDITTKVGTAAATTFAEGVKSDAAVGKKLKLTACSDVTVQYLPTCASKASTPFKLSASDSFDIEEDLKAGRANTYTYTTKCIQTPKTLTPKPGTNKPADCEIGIKYDDVEDACGVATKVPGKTIAVTATWDDPTTPAGPFCPGDKVTLDAIKVTALKDAEGAAIDPSFTTGFDLTFDILTKKGEAAAVPFKVDIPSGGPVTSQLTLSGCSEVNVIYKPQCAAPKPALSLEASDDLKPTDICGDTFKTRCQPKATLTFSNPDFVEGDEGQCYVKLERSGKNACGAALTFPDDEVNICEGDAECFPPSVPTDQIPA